MAHRLARALLLVLAVLVIGWAASPAAAADQRPSAAAEDGHRGGPIVDRTSQHGGVQARPAGPDHPLQLASMAPAATVAGPSARATHTSADDPARPVGMHRARAASRAPPRLP